MSRILPPHAMEPVPVKRAEFWPAAQRSSHSLHEISYRACFKAQLPRKFIESFTNPGDLVYDPFMGRGTTVLEATLLGRHAVGNDINPLSRILIGPRLVRQTIDSIQSRVAEVSLRHPRVDNPDLDPFFHPDTQAELYAWQRYFRNRRETGLYDQVDAWIRMVACNRLTGHSSGFFSVYTMPPNQAVSPGAQRRINQRRKQEPDYRATKELILKKSRSLLRSPYPEVFGVTKPTLHCRSAEDTPMIPDQSVHLIVTSPPFLNIVDYHRDNWLRNWFCETAPEKDAVWQLHSVADWTGRMKESLSEFRRILAPAGHTVIEVGEVRSGSVNLEEPLIEAGRAAGLRPVEILIHEQEFTKTSNCWGVSNNTKGTNTQRMVVLKND